MRFVRKDMQQGPRRESACPATPPAWQAGGVSCFWTPLDWGCFKPILGYQLLVSTLKLLMEQQHVLSSDLTHGLSLLQSPSRHHCQQTCVYLSVSSGSISNITTKPFSGLAQKHASSKSATRSICRFPPQLCHATAASTRTCTQLALGSWSVLLLGRHIFLCHATCGPQPQ